MDHLDGIVIRMARAEDLPALRNLAERDSAELPASPLLVAVAGGEIRAASSVRTRETIADPFTRTRDLARLLTARVDQLREPAGRGLRNRIAAPSWRAA